MAGLQLIDMDLDIKVVKDSSGKIESGLVLADTLSQNQALILQLHKGELKDAVQGATGVVDVVLGDVRTKPMTRSEFLLAQGNNVVSVSGAFAVDSLKNTISYVQEL